MANDNVLTLVGNLTTDPELSLTKSKIPVCNFTVAYTPRVLDRARDEWVDGDPLFLRCTVWGTHAENAAASLNKGQRVVVLGRLKQSQWEDKDGNKRTTIELEVDEVGHSLRFGQSEFTRSASKAAPSKGLR